MDKKTPRLEANFGEIFRPKEIKPRGWLKKQLRTQADGLCGNLDKVWPDVKESQWFGGKREGWERAPYWLDGFVPMAYLLRDKDLIARADKYMDYIIKAQKEDGWLFPSGDTNEEREQFDEWAAFLILKAMWVYYDCSGDKRVPGAVYKALKHLKWRIDHFAMHSWGCFRWFECLIPLFRTYERTPEYWMIDFAYNLYENGFAYDKFLTYWREDEPRRGDWHYSSHIVNIAMAYKWQALFSRIFNSVETGRKMDPDSFAKMFDKKLLKYHGSVVGHVNGDECLAGTSANAGAELCSIVEAMYSFEVIYGRTGDPYWMDRLEQLAFNSLPATMTEDMWAHQYDQCVNQIAATKFEEDCGKPFMTNGREASIFGLEPNYGCCTGNFGQGYPKFALSVFYRTKDGIAAGAIAPAELNTKIDDAKVNVICETNYPFDNSVVYRIKTDKPVKFSFTVRGPQSAEEIRVNGKKISGFTKKITRVFEGQSEINLKFVMKPKFEKAPGGEKLYAVKYGNLVFALPLEINKKRWEYTAEKVRRKYPYCDYLMTAKSDWERGFASKESDIKITFNPKSKDPFTVSDPGITAEVETVGINWGLDKDCRIISSPAPASEIPLSGPEKTVLVPYAAAKLRMTVMPRTGKPKKTKKQ